MELALPLLPLIAPDVAAPIAYRDGDEPPASSRSRPASSSALRFARQPPKPPARGGRR